MGGGSGEVDGALAMSRGTAAGASDGGPTGNTGGLDAASELARVRRVASSDEDGCETETLLLRRRWAASGAVLAGHRCTSGEL